MEDRQPSGKYDWTSDIREKLEKLSIQSLPLPEEIIKVTNTVQSNNDTPGEIKIGPEGKLLQEFLQFEGLTKQIIHAYDYWLENILPRRIVTTVIPFSLGTIRFKDVTIMKPTFEDPETNTKNRKIMYPHYARRNKVTYAVSVYVKIMFFRKDNDNLANPNQEEECKLAEIPVMLGSKYCNLYGLNERQLLDVGECGLDPNGYFIIDGQEKIVLQHDKLRFNKPFIFSKENKNKNKESGIFEEYVNINSKKQEFSTVICRFTAMPTLDSTQYVEQKIYTQDVKFDAKKSTVVNMRYDLSNKSIVVQLDRFISGTSIDIYHLYELFGVKSDKAIDMILNFMFPKNQAQAKNFLLKILKTDGDLIAKLKEVMKMPDEIEKSPTQKQIEYYQERIGEVLFKQTEGSIYQTNEEKYEAKLQMLSIMCARYVEYHINKRTMDDRDSWSNKRVVSAGPAIEHLFNQIWNYLVVESLINSYLKTVTINEQNFTLVNAINKLPSSFIKDTFIKSFNPNNWGVPQSILKENMTDILKNETLLAKYSQILRISPETSDKGKQTSIREVHATQVGYICPVETPEGKQCGIVKSLAVGCFISIGKDESIIVNFVTKNMMRSRTMNLQFNTALVLNGKFIGWCNGSETEKQLKIARRTQKIHRDTMIYLDPPKILWVYCDGGRPTRPLLVVDQETNQLVIDMKNMWNASFPELIQEGCIEYIDALEQEQNCVVAQSIWDFVYQNEDLTESASVLSKPYRDPTAPRNPVAFETFSKIVKTQKYTHCEMDPNAILSLVASIIPMPDRSQAPRNTYQTSMGKQALSIQNTNAINRFDVEVKSLAYPSRTIFETQMYKYIGLDQLPIGETVMVAIMPYMGYNQEDAIIINQASVDNGLFRIVRTITYKTVQLSDHKFIEVFQKPVKKVKNAQFLDEDGVILPGTYVSQDDCLIGKVKKIHGTGEVVDTSVYVGIGDSGIVERVLKTTSSDSRKIVMVKIREVRKPRAGDKCACFTDKTEILTQNRGWISIKDVSLDDQVATLDNGKLRYTQPEMTMDYDYEGPMYQLESNQVDLLTTPNHNLYVKERNSEEYKLIRADRVFGKRVNHKKNAMNDNIDDCLENQSYILSIFGTKNMIRTNDKNIVNRLQISALHSGWSINNFSSDNEEFVLFLDKYSENIEVSQESQESWIQYSGKVYCCTVPTGVIYVRHNLKPVWCGNSRYAQKGTIGIVLPKEDMPFVSRGPNSGVTPDLIINPHCFTGDSLVGLSNGLSRKISSFSSQGCETVWTIGENGMIHRHTLGMESKGVKDIVQVTLMDGRKLRCTSDHKFVCLINGERVGVEASQLTGKEVVMSPIECVEDVVETDEVGWELKTSEYTFKMDTPINREKTLAFARILGFVLTDGTVYKDKRDDVTFQCPVSVGTVLDLKMVLDDVELISGKRPKARKDYGKGTVFVFNMPRIISKTIGNLDGVTVGRRTTQEASWPKFLLEDSCPKSFLREFIAGLFGGDGHCPTMNRGKLMAIHFSKSIVQEFIDSLKTKMNQLCQMMERVGVQAKISRVRKTHTQTDEYKNRPRLQCEIVVPNTLQFSEKIGFRYCVQKMSRLSLACAYERLQENVRKQMNFVTRRTSEIFDGCQTKKTLAECMEQARNELKNGECVLNEYYSLSNIQTINNRRKPNRSSTLKSFDYDYFPTFEKFLKQVGCLDWFDQSRRYINNSDDNFVHTYQMKVLDVRPCGQEEVYDIGVSEFHYFTTQSVCVYNCIPSRMTIGKMIEIMTSKVGAMNGEKINATAFRPFQLQSYCDSLSSYGFDRYGSEKMTNGMEGNEFEGNIFMGPCYYQALKHHVQDKIQQRGRGAIKSSTHQPTAGRTKGGGIRVGEMERDALISHGAVSCQKEKTFDHSDPFKTLFCVNCGKIADIKKNNLGTICGMCGKANYGLVSIPYSTKLLLQELGAASISIKFKLKKKEGIKKIE